MVNVVDELSSEVFRLLCTEGKSLTFSEAKEKEAMRPEADQLGFLLGQPDEDDEADAGEQTPAPRHVDTKLQTAMGSEVLQKRLLSLHYDARTALEESGVNTLFLALGQLKWRDDRMSEIDRYAPLLFVPVELTRKGAKSKFKLAAIEPEASDNLSLAAKLKGMGITLPQWDSDDDSTPAEYFSAVADVVADQKGWEVLPNKIVLGFFSFAKFLMHRDLDPETWPDESPLDSKELVANLMGEGFPATESTVAPDAQLDDLVPVERLSHVIDADSSQAIAVEEVRGNRSIIIQGPPGTGKSQTITNLIATAVLDGKKVLFVAEKLAALEVVKRRLDALGLGPLALELHSYKSDKKSVLAELGATLELGSPVFDGEQRTATELKAMRERLNKHAAMLNEPREPSALTPIKVIGRLCALRGQIEDRHPPSFEGALDWTPEQRRERERLIDDLQTLLAEIGHPAKHPWRGVTVTALTKFDGEEIAANLPDLHSALADLGEFGSTLADAVGVPLPTNVAATRSLLDWSIPIATVPDLDARALGSGVWQRDTLLLRGVVEAGGKVASVRKRYSERFIDSAWTTDVGGMRRSIAAHGQSFFRMFNSGYRNAMAEFRSLLSDGKPPKEYGERLELLDALATAENLRRDLKEHSERVQEAFGEKWAASRSDWGALSLIIDWVEQTKADGHDEEFFAHLAEHGVAPEKCREESKRVSTTLEKFGDLLSSFLEKVGLELSVAFGGDTASPDALNFEVLAERIEIWQGSVESLHSWVTYWNRATRCNDLGVGVIPNRIYDCTLNASEARQAFDFGYMRQLYMGFAADTDALAKFDGQSHTALVERFRANDLKRIDLARYEVMRKHYDGMPKAGDASMGAVGILKGELARKRGHMPIRRLLARTGSALQAIKPVFMMSPMSVAQFLEPGRTEFDLVIFDEASQIQPVDALGAVARAKQIVVVGDEKQLPPSNFFTSLGIDVDDDDENGAATVGDMESLLGLANAKGLSSSMLRWHYRSRHQSLIAVSNHEFYDDKLFIVPSPQRELDDVGLGFHYVERGVYDRGKSQRNAEEAKTVANRVMRHAEEKAGKSLGVGAFSVAQRDAILDELELLRRERPELESFFHSHEHEPFFVKNLENLQGDERDVILISVGYGKDENDFFAMNFGPLNNEGGERRLNVLISRAKERCEVFASIHADEIDLNRSRKRGVAALKTFLNFAENGILGTPEPETDRGVESPFEESVKRELEREGYIVHTQVGTAGFFVDLAVVDSDQPSRYLLGIECDGASYHSARSARERDRQREAVLENHGWKIHRIWSTDWFVEPKKQLRRVVQAIEDARGSSGKEPELERVESSVPVELARAPEMTDERPLATPYQEAEYDPETQMDIHEVSPVWMADLILFVLKIEAPIHVAEVTARIRNFWGVGRAGSRIKAAITDAIALLVADGKAKNTSDFLALPGGEIIVRNRANSGSTSLMKPEMLPPAEISKAVVTLIESNHGVGAKDIAVGVGRMFGFKSTSKQLRAVVDRELVKLVEGGEIVESGGLLKIRGNH